MSAFRVMTSRAAAELYDLIASTGIDLWLDGGWAVDALLGAESRVHGDLDVVIQAGDLGVLVNLLESAGFVQLPRFDTRPWNFVLGAADGREVDAHVIQFDSAGNGVYGPEEDGTVYPQGSLMGHGIISNRIVRCVAPEYLVQFHLGYQLSKKDVLDVTALCARFGLDLPDEIESMIDADQS